MDHSWWRHPMETFSVLLAICAGNSPALGEFAAQRPVTRSFDVSLMCVWINDWVNNREAGDLRRNRAHYDVIVMWRVFFIAMCSFFIKSSYATELRFSLHPFSGNMLKTISSQSMPYWRTYWIEKVTSQSPTRYLMSFIIDKILLLRFG